MAKRRPEPEPPVVLGPSTAARILQIVKRHANVRFDNSQDRELLIEELANLVPTADVLPEAEPGARRVEAAGQGQQVQGNTGENGDQSDDDGQGAGE